ncbi:MAG: S8 family peptidase [Eubacteriales bacterium]|nr:S8 family peptidase [Eubacteriales bacterium]
MKKKLFAIFMSAVLSASNVLAGYALPGIGPGLNNIAPSDPYSVYQWGFQNNGGLSLNTADLRRESFYEIYQGYLDWYRSKGLGIPPRSLEPGDFESRVIRSVEGIDMNVRSAFELYRNDTGERRDVVVAIIDTEIDMTHPELANALWTNEDEIPGDGIDNDGNGYTDDVHGYDFYGHQPLADTVGREALHGTHAAGTIAAAYGNGGITGLTDNEHVKIMVLKALGGEGTGSEQSVSEAIRYAEANGADICNLSIGSTRYMPALEQQIANSPMLFVVAAGNGDARGIGYDTDTNPVYPASYASENVISVANLMFDGTLDGSSNYGAESVDLAAPGSYVLSTSPGGGYEFLTGTSMAAPMVTGVCAMIYSYRTDFGLLKVKEAVLSTVKKLESLSGMVKSGGMPDLYAAMQYER